MVDNRILGMDADALYGLNTLHSLTLDRCHLRSMPPVADVKDTLINLAIIQNLVTYIPADYFKGFAQLQTLSLMYNRLAQFPDVYPLNHTLNTIYLVVNRITQMTQSVIPSCSKFKQFSVRRNKLVTLNGSIFGGGHVVMEVSMLDNPWRCDTSLAWLCNLEYGNFTEEFSGRKLQIPMFGRARFSDYNLLEYAQPDLNAGAKIRDFSMLMGVETYMHIPVQ